MEIKRNRTKKGVYATVGRFHPETPEPSTCVRNSKSQPDTGETTADAQ